MAGVFLDSAAVEYAGNLSRMWISVASSFGCEK